MTPWDGKHVNLHMNFSGRSCNLVFSPPPDNITSPQEQPRVRPKENNKRIWERARGLRRPWTGPLHATVQFTPHPVATWIFSL